MAGDDMTRAFLAGFQCGAEYPADSGDGDAMYQHFRGWRAANEEAPQLAAPVGLVKRLVARIDEAATYKRQIEDAAKLVVRPIVTGDIYVDASALMRSKNDIQTWVLSPVLSGPESGQWRHAESDTSAPLSEALRAIACCYQEVPV